jgi:hypothetical protein
MKKNVLVFGLIAGLIITGMMIYSAALCCANPEAKSNAVLGYASMIIAFSFIFIGIRNFRDKYNGGVISFGKAFQVGLFITLVASTIYVLVWLVDYYLFIPDFMDKYTQHVLHEARTGGATQLQLDEKAAEMADFKQLYKNPLFVILISYAEVLPVGLVVSLIGALILKKGNKKDAHAGIKN